MDITESCKNYLQLCYKSRGSFGHRMTDKQSQITRHDRRNRRESLINGKRNIIETPQHETNTIKVQKIDKAQERKAKLLEWKQRKEAEKKRMMQEKKLKPVFKVSSSIRHHSDILLYEPSVQGSSTKPSNQLNKSKVSNALNLSSKKKVNDKKLNFSTAKNKIAENNQQKCKNVGSKKKSGNSRDPPPVLKSKMETKPNKTVQNDVKLTNKTKDKPLSSTNKQTISKKTNNSKNETIFKNVKTENLSNLQTKKEATKNLKKDLKNTCTKDIPKSDDSETKNIKKIRNSKTTDEFPVPLENNAIKKTQNIELKNKNSPQIKTRSNKKAETKEQIIIIEDNADVNAENTNEVSISKKSRSKKRKSRISLSNRLQEIKENDTSNDLISETEYQRENIVTEAPILTIDLNMENIDKTSAAIKKRRSRISIVNKPESSAGTSTNNLNDTQNNFHDLRSKPQNTSTNSSILKTPKDKRKQSRYSEKSDFSSNNITNIDNEAPESTKSSRKTRRSRISRVFEDIPHESTPSINLETKNVSPIKTRSSRKAGNTQNDSNYENSDPTILKTPRSTIKTRKSKISIVLNQPDDAESNSIILVEEDKFTAEPTGSNKRRRRHSNILKELNSNPQPSKDDSYLMLECREEKISTGEFNEGELESNETKKSIAKNRRSRSSLVSVIEGSNEEQNLASKIASNSEENQVNWRTPVKDSNATSSIYLSPFVVVSRGKREAAKEIRTNRASLPDGLRSCFSPKVGAKYFREKLNKEVERITEQCNKWQNYKENEHPSEEGCDIIDMAIGQSTLLMNKKFKQFEKLIERCESKESGDSKPVTTNDLHGFWDVMYKQVTDLDRRFNNLEEMSRNSWLHVTPKPKEKKRVVKKAATKTQKGPSSAIRRAIQAARQKMKQSSNNADSDAVEILEPLQNKQLEAVKRTPRVRLSSVETPGRGILKSAKSERKAKKSVLFQDMS